MTRSGGGAKVQIADNNDPLPGGLRPLGGHRESIRSQNLVVIT
jgi:hypothetical protein